MDIKLFKELAGDIDEYSISDIEALEIMTPDEVEEILRDTEKAGGNHSDWDVLRLCFTCKYLFKEMEG